MIGSARVLVALILAAAMVWPQEANDLPTVRVLIIERATSLELACKGPVELRSPERARPLGRYSALGEIRIDLGARGFRIGKKRFPVSWLTLIAGDEPFRLKDRRYPGALHLVREKDFLRVVNEVDIETYVGSVVRWEMGVSVPLAAMKVQAIAARSFVAAGIPGFPRPQGKRLTWDVHDDTKSQVYKGLPGRHPLLEKAVRETSGVVVTWRGKIVRTYYSAACGGTTRGQAEWTGKREIPPLSGVTCGFCDSRGRWKKELSFEEIEGALGDRLSGMRIKRVAISERTRSGRPAKIRLEGRGSRLEIDAAEFREIFDIATTLFDLRQEKEVLHLEGAGDGHGVGLCQVGAQAMSRQGWSHEKILAHYYPGGELRAGYGASRSR